MNDPSLPTTWTAEQEREFRKLQHEAVIGTRCESCGYGNWYASGFFSVRTVEQDGSSIEQGGVVPMVVTVCSTCGNVRFYSAVALGLL